VVYDDTCRSHNSKGVRRCMRLLARRMAGGTEVKVRALLTPVPYTNNGHRIAAVTLDVVVHVNVCRGRNSKGVLHCMRLDAQRIAGGTEVKVWALLTSIPCTNEGQHITRITLHAHVNDSVRFNTDSPRTAHWYCCG